MDKAIQIEVTFVEDRIVYDENNEPIDEFKAGKSYKLSANSANRWIRRGCAVKGKLPKGKPENAGGNNDDESNKEGGKGAGGKA